MQLGAFNSIRHLSSSEVMRRRLQRAASITTHSEQSKIWIVCKLLASLEPLEMTGFVFHLCSAWLKLIAFIKDRISGIDYHLHFKITQFRVTDTSPRCSTIIKKTTTAVVEDVLCLLWMHFVRGNGDFVGFAVVASRRNESGRQLEALPGQHFLFL